MAAAKGWLRSAALGVESCFGRGTRREGDVFKEYGIIGDLGSKTLLQTGSVLGMTKPTDSLVFEKGWHCPMEYVAGFDQHPLEIFNVRELLQYSTITN